MAALLLLLLQATATSAFLLSSPSSVLTSSSPASSLSLASQRSSSPLHARPTPCLGAPSFHAQQKGLISLRMSEDNEEEMAKKYYEQNSGLGYRKNDQDVLLFATGALILFIPLIFVGIAIATGYVPLDYLR
ncbi:hypothetical protein GUITHDRAFT_165676 [Guillardia theta CCMP2712]|uniref:Uncharacterized protein n=2 Tax=Guillardia theta TaxID=55529 RepID=L1IKG4_GUITC|nr:hypothetical protein GUITHDRAFT_165676 [Guillardia theta CCMP2712]EKX36617.1 hypothetical protein GUITHDRAFT_165676 [Guillardia theta CCMP2712]|eukprot:XP_005823597.1 hypothetical protein GUITHDRAFT_165676 [Guillardia theta CCMP2712]